MIGKAKQQTWRLTFEGTDDEPVPVELRVRHLLKFARRTLGLKCVDVDGGHDDVGKLVPVEPEIDASKTDTTF